MTIRVQDMTGFVMPDIEPGTVWLVGAGPGDPGLLTLLGVHGLQQADAVVYDALVDERLLTITRDDCEHIFAGKRGGRPSPKQPDISKRLVDLAKEGKRVLRLKGGDPFVFGRGGEECLTLVKAGVSFRIVPGVTAGVGGLAYAGIPTTHRDVNSAVTFVTGHSQTGDIAEDLDWDSLAKGSPVLIFYMALKHLNLIADRLIQGGRSPDEPVALVSKATTAEQRVLETTLASCHEDRIKHGIEAPTIVVVGETVRLRDMLNWVDKL